LSIKKPIEVVAHSFGGRIAFYVAVHASESIKKLFLIAPGGVEQQPSKIKKGIFTLGKHLLPEKAQQYLKKHLSSVDYQQAGKLTNMFKKVVNEDLRALFFQISQPISLYW
jgi:pimeloyl-ACP methyl ester carboxylesterase